VHRVAVAVIVIIIVGRIIQVKRSGAVVARGVVVIVAIGRGVAVVVTIIAIKLEMRRC
jgi:hypothetical protein